MLETTNQYSTQAPTATHAVNELDLVQPVRAENHPSQDFLFSGPLLSVASQNAPQGTPPGLLEVAQYMSGFTVNRSAPPNSVR